MKTLHFQMKGLIDFKNSNATLSTTIIWAVFYFQTNRVPHQIFKTHEIMSTRGGKQEQEKGYN